MADSPQEHDLHKDIIDHTAPGSPPPEGMADGQDGNGFTAYEFEVKEQDRWLPIANVARIMKTALPENAKIAKEAKECMQECVSEFISFITSEASEKCHQEKRKTVNGEDILFAMTSLGFENYAEALKIYLSKYRDQQNNNAREPTRPTSQEYGAGEPDFTQAGEGSSNGAAFPPAGSEEARAAEFLYEATENVGVNPEPEY